jgi:enediyne biosynthesis protein E4
VTSKSGTGGDERSTFTALWFDANNDGKPDLYVPNEFGDGVLYINQGNGTFRPTSLAKGACDFGTMGATCGDIDNDGNIDLFCGNMYSKAGSRVISNVRPGTYPEDVMARIRSFVKGSELHLNRGGTGFEQKGRDWQVADAGWSYGPALVDLDNDGWLDIYATCGYISRSRTEPDG